MLNFDKLRNYKLLSVYLTNNQTLYNSSMPAWILIDQCFEYNYFDDNEAEEEDEGY